MSNVHECVWANSGYPGFGGLLPPRVPSHWLRGLAVRIIIPESSCYKRFSGSLEWSSMSWTFWIFLLTDMGFNSTLVSFIGRIHHSSPFLNFYIAAGRGKSFSPIPNVFFMPAMEHEVGYGISLKMGSLTGSCQRRRACILKVCSTFCQMVTKLSLTPRSQTSTFTHTHSPHSHLLSRKTCL